MDSITSNTLLHALKLGRTDGWARFVHLYGPLIRKWISRAGLAEEDAEDIAQDVFVAAAEGFSSYRHSEHKAGSLRAWLYGISRHKLNDWYREHPLQLRAAGGSAASLRMQQFAFPEQDSECVQQTRMQLAVRALGLLETDFSATTWQAFWRTAILNEKTVDVAKDLGMTSKAIRQSRYRVLRHLRKELGDDVPAREFSRPAEALV